MEQEEHVGRLLLDLVTCGHSEVLHDELDDHSEDLLDTEHLHDNRHHQLCRTQSVTYEGNIEVRGYVQADGD